MDDSLQKQNQTNDLQEQPQVAQVSVPNKEAEQAPVSDYVLPSEKEPELPKEVQDAGVEKHEQYPALTEEHFKVGIKHSGPTTPVKTEPTGAVKLPMTQAQARQKAKGNTIDATTWLANFILRLLKKMRISKTVS